MALDTSLVLLAVSGIVILGFLGILLFRRTRIPDVIWLILLGLVLGPINESFLHIEEISALLTPERIDLVTPPLSTLALIVILFEAGLNIKLSSLRRVATPMAVHTMGVFVLTAVLVYFAAQTFFSYPPPIALLVGVILAGTSGAVVVGMMRLLHVRSELKALLVLEAILTTVIATALVQAILVGVEAGRGVDGAFIARFVGGNLAVGIGIGVPSGLAWLFVLNRVARVPFAFMTTVAATFVVFVAAEAVRGNGLLAVFAFGLVLGNGETAMRLLGRLPPSIEDENFRRFMAEASFLVSTFFFVILGLLFRPAALQTEVLRPSIPGLEMLSGTAALFAIGMAIFVAIFALARFAVAPITARILRADPAERFLLWSLFPRGKVTVVLFLLPFSWPAFADPSSAYHLTFAPYRDVFVNTALIVVLASVALSTVASAVFERRVAAGRPVRMPEPSASYFLDQVDELAKEPGESELPRSADVPALPEDR